MVLCDAGFDVDEQVEIRDERGAFVARFDLMVRGTRVVIEVDGLSKYADRDVLRAEKVREEKLRRLGYLVIRVLAADLRRPDRVIQAVHTALTSAAA